MLLIKPYRHRQNDDRAFVQILYEQKAEYRHADAFSEMDQLTISRGWQILKRFRVLISTTVKGGIGKLSRWQFAGANLVFFSIVIGLA
ncbi:MAG: hypothetical protein ACRD82_04440 [Blastocatellia bacterium]